MRFKFNNEHTSIKNINLNEHINIKNINLHKHSDNKNTTNKSINNNNMDSGCGGNMCATYLPKPMPIPHIYHSLGKSLGRRECTL